MALRTRMLLTAGALVLVTLVTAGLSVRTTRPASRPATAVQPQP